MRNVYDKLFQIIICTLVHITRSVSYYSISGKGNSQLKNTPFYSCTLQDEDVHL